MPTKYSIGDKFYNLSNEEYAEIATYCNEHNGIYLSQEDGYFEIKEDDFVMSEEEYLYLLREQRQNECFSVINRGALWYRELTYAQEEELNAWYKAWLDVTETKIVPEKPVWLK